MHSSYRSPEGWDSLNNVIIHNREKNQLIVAFSGTWNVPQLIDEIADSRFVDYELHPVQNGSAMEYFYKHYINGFRTQFVKDFKDALEHSNPTEIVFTGHSLGGSIVLHAALDMVLGGVLDQTKQTIKIYTYGQPRISNYELEHEFAKRDITLYRLVHHRDIVAHLPPCNVFGEGEGCSKDGKVGPFPYHPPTEIFYDSDFVEYKECDHKEGEDMSCSNGIIDFGLFEHNWYFNIPVGGCDDIIVTPGAPKFLNQ